MLHVSNKFLISFSCMVLLWSCNGQLKNEKTVFEKRDNKGQLKERFGNYHEKDRNTNFRSFFFYNGSGKLIRERNYFFEDSNIECRIIDTSDFSEILYMYSSSGKLQIEEIFHPKYDENGKVIQLFLAYRIDHISGQEESFQEPE